MTWNRAAMQWANYRTPKPRVMHGPTLGQGPYTPEMAKTMHLGTHACCGYHVCHCWRREKLPKGQGYCVRCGAQAVLVETLCQPCDRALEAQCAPKPSNARLRAEVGLVERLRAMDPKP